MFGLTAATAALIKLIPYVTNAVPASLVSIIIVTIIAKVDHNDILNCDRSPHTHMRVGLQVLKLPATTLADMAGAETFKGGLSIIPSLTLPAVPFTLVTLAEILPYR